MATLGEKLKLLRKEMGLRQSDVVGEALSRTSLSKLENDLTKPSIETLEYLSMRFKKPVAYFFDHPSDLANPNHDREVYYTELLQTIHYGQVALLDEYLKESHPENLSDEDPFKGKSYQAVAEAFLTHRDYDRSEAYIAIAIPLLEVFTDLYHLSKAKLVKGHILLYKELQTEALDTFKDGLNDLRHSFISDYALETEFLLNIATGFKQKNQPIDAINTLQDALRLADKHLVYTYTGELLSLLAQLQSEIGDINSAIRTARRRCYLYEFTGSSRKLNETYVTLSRYYYSCQSYKEAQDLVTAATAYFTDEDIRLFRIDILQKLLNIQLSSGKQFESDLNHAVWTRFNPLERLQWLSALKENMKRLSFSIQKLEPLKKILIAEDPLDKDAITALADIYSLSGEYETAFSLIKLTR